MGAITKTLLERHGLRVSPDEVQAFMVAAIQSLGAVPVRDEPGRDLTEPELALLQASGWEAPGPLEPSEDPLFRGAATYWEILTTSVSTAEAADRLGVDESRIRQRLRDRTLYGIKEAGSWRLPAFQLVGDGVLPGLADVLPALQRDLHPVAVHRWFTSPHPDLVPDGADGPALSPRDWLLTGGDPARVAALARAVVTG